MIITYREMVKKLIKKFNQKKKDLIIDVGSNDGVTLDQYPKNKYNLLELNHHLQSIMLEKKIKLYQKNFLI